MKAEAGNSLRGFGWTRGASPLRWLSIVYGIWLDPRWYWRTIRPRMRREWLAILIQALLGAFLAAAGAALLCEAILALAGIATDWAGALRDTLYSGILAVPFGLFLGLTLPNGGSWRGSTDGGLPRRAAHSIPPVVTFISISGFSPLLHPLAGWAGGPSIVSAAGFAAAVIAVVGLAYGVGVSVALGSLPRWTYPAIALTGLIIAGIFVFSKSEQAVSPLLPLGLSAGIALAMLLAERWAIRQVADSRTRRELADPE
jgi:hypothetical protein